MIMHEGEGRGREGQTETQRESDRDMETDRDRKTDRKLLGISLTHKSKYSILDYEERHLGCFWKKAGV